MFEGQRASQVLQCAVPMEAGDGDPCGSTATKVIVLETMEAPENGHAGIGTSPKRVMGLITQLKCTCSNAHSVVTNRRRSWKLLCIRKAVTSLPAQTHVG